MKNEKNDDIMVQKTNDLDYKVWAIETKLKPYRKHVLP